MPTASVGIAAGEFARQSKAPLHLADVMEFLGITDPAHASHHLKRALQAGVVRKIGMYGGWVAMG
jgi:hypothetical protein